MSTASERPVASANLSGRQQTILQFARDRGEVQVELLAESFQVTPQTIRRDLNQLCQLRLLQRVHGGAVVYGGVANLGYSARKRLMPEAKTEIAKIAATFIPDDSSLFINIGTTTERVAEHLVGHIGLLAITNNLNVVNVLRQSNSIDVMMAGGTVRREDGGIVGEATVDFINQFKVDYAIIGASAIEADGTVLDYDVREVRVAQAIIKNARSVILVADAMKFDRNAPVRIGSVADVDYFICDKQPSDLLMQICHENDVQVRVATQH